VRSHEEPRETTPEATTWWELPLDARLGAFVVLAGVGLCTSGTLLEPRSTPSVEFAWWAQMLALAFWGGACGAAAGLLRRRRYGLWGAFVSALSFLVAAAIVPSVTTAGVTAAWFAELTCAIAFFAIAVWALAVSSSRTQESEKDQGSRRAHV
jgi:peptidoglycan/LPS O-acetylase OafA/YrhL